MIVDHDAIHFEHGVDDRPVCGGVRVSDKAAPCRRPGCPNDANCHAGVIADRQPGSPPSIKSEATVIRTAEEEKLVRRTSCSQLPGVQNMAARSWTTDRSGTLLLMVARFFMSTPRIAQSKVTTAEKR